MDGNRIESIDESLNRRGGGERDRGRWGISGGLAGEDERKETNKMASGGRLNVRQGGGEEFASNWQRVGKCESNGGSSRDRT